MQKEDMERIFQETRESCERIEKVMFNAINKELVGETVGEAINLHVNIAATVAAKAALIASDDHRDLVAQAMAHLIALKIAEAEVEFEAGESTEVMTCHPAPKKLQ